MPDEKRIKRLFNLLLADWQKIWDYQKGLCAICQRPLRKANVDHCHASGLVRGLLCFRCNRALGAFFDDLFRLRNAVHYLERPPATEALGAERYGLPGRVDTKKQRRLAKKMKKALDKQKQV